MTKQTTTTTTAKTEETAAQRTLRLQLEAQLAAQITERHYAPFDVSSMEKRIAYVTAGNGLFKHTRTETFVFTQQVEKFDSPILGLPDMEPGIQLLIPKIPGQYLSMMLNWYRDVHTKDGTECSTLFFWNHDNIAIPETDINNKPVRGLTVDGQLIVYIPVQKNSSGLSEFHMDPMVDWFRQNMSLVAEWHSHHTMGAFYSATDNANENMLQFYGVWGNIKHNIPAWVFSYVVDGKRHEAKLSDLFDIPQVELETKVVKSTRVLGDDTVVLHKGVGEMREENATSEVVDFNGPWAATPYPDDWMGQHTPAHSRYTPSSARNRGRQSAGWGWGGRQDDYDYLGPGWGHTRQNNFDLFEEEEEIFGVPLDDRPVTVQTTLEMNDPGNMSYIVTYLDDADKTPENDATIHKLVNHIIKRDIAHRT